MLGHRPVHLVDEDDVGLAGREAGLDQLLEQGAGIDRAAHALVLGRLEFELGALANRFHEFVGDQHAMVQVQCLAVEVAAGFADFEEFLDLGMVDVDVAGGRTAAQRALRDGEGERVHDAHERDDAAGLAVEADRLANAAHRAPIGADAATLGGEPDIFVPGADNAFEAVVDAVQIAADRQAAFGAAVGQDRRRRHEPELGDIVVDALGMLGIVGIGRGDAGEEILVGFAGQEIAVAQGFLAELGQLFVAAVIDLDVESALRDLLAVALGFAFLDVIGWNVAAGRKVHLITP